MDTAATTPVASTERGDSWVESAAPVAASLAQGGERIAAGVLDELCAGAGLDACGLEREEFAGVLAAVGEKHNCNLPPGTVGTVGQQAAFFRGLHLADLAMAHGCALGRDQAWELFLARYRAPLTAAAVAITGSATLGHDLADSLYGELFGLPRGGGAGDGAAARRSPLASYSGRGSLIGWLRSTLAQRHVDHHRRTRREAPLEAIDNTPAAAAPTPAVQPQLPELSRLSDALTKSLGRLDAESRFLLSAYFLDGQTLLQIARLMRVHEATISRRLKRIADDLRKDLLRTLQAGDPPWSKRAAEEALGTDPRDLELNLRSLLQTSQSPPFLKQAVVSEQAMTLEQPSKI